MGEQSHLGHKQMQPDTGNAAPQAATVRRKRKPWGIIVAILAIVVAAGLAFGGYIFYTYLHGQEEYEDLYDYMQIDANDNTPTLADFKIDWDGLRKINPDIVGWVYLPNTIINYPIVWKEGDSDYYMHHNFSNGSAGPFGAEYGCPTLCSGNAPNWSDQANFVAGHHMRNGSMFSFLQNMQESPVFNKHRTFYLLTPETNYRLEAIACDKTLGSSEDVIIPLFSSAKDFASYIQKQIDNSKAVAKPPVETLDGISKIVAFYTCSEPDNQYRIIVYTAVRESVPASGSVEGGSEIDASVIEDVGSAAKDRLKKK